MSDRKIFVCYRREDSAGHAGRLYDRLNLRFPGRVFMDVAAIGLGTRWAEVIEQTLGSCEVVLLLIGRRWLERLPDGTRRIDDPDDPLRAEITTALRLQRRIVPVLVGGATMPASADLPDDVAPITDWQALSVADDDFDHDAQRLIRAIERYLHEGSDDPHLEQQGARRAQVEALLAESEAAARAGAWVNAAQTLRSVLSLDPGNPRAAAALRDVETRWAAAYGQGQARASVPSRRRTWAVLGVVAVLGAICAAAVGLVVLVALVTEDAASGTFGPEYRFAGPGVETSTAPAAPSTDAGGAAAAGEGARPAASVPPPASRAASPSLAARLPGEYVLAAYSQQGTRLPVVGRLTIVDAGGGVFRFETHAANQVTGAAFWCRGLLQQHDGRWTMTTTESNDPTVLSYPVPTRLSLDGGLLTASNDFGEATVWQKQ